MAYSSLRRLRDLPTKWIKIDKSFLVGVPGNEGATRVLEAILQLLSALEVRVVIEGVESAAQCAWLRERNCEAAQGWFLGMPQPAEELETLLRATEPRRSAAPRA